MLCTTHGDTSVFNSPASFSTSVVIPQQSDTLSSSLHNTAPAQFPLQWPIQLTSHFSDVLPGDPACPPVLLQVSTFWKIYIQSIIYFYVADSLLFKVLYRSSHSVCIWLNTVWLVFLLQSLGANTHMFEGIFVVWVTPNIWAFSRPLFLLAYIQMQMPYVTFYNVFKQRPMPSLRILIFSLLTFSCFQLVCCYSGVGKVLQCLKSPKS